MKRLVLLLFSLSFLGCGTIGGVRTSLEHNQHSMSYSLDSVETRKKEDILVYLNDIKFMAGNLPDSMIVEKEERYFIPLVLFNFWKGTYLCKLGQENISEELESFIADYFRSEVERSGRFQLTDDVNADYQLNIEFSKISSEGSYTKDGYFNFLIIFYMWGSSQSTSNIHASVQSNVKLSANNEIVFEKEISKEMSQVPISTSSMTVTQLQYTFTSQLVKVLSDCFKECFEDIVAELNNLID